ncbi:MAG: hypothetical protein JWM10_2702 [Myxococcaceae bacterium]|nr:hypothetical protein [Myxococcaceae bacterium]
MRASPLPWLLGIGLLVSCTRGDPWAPCREAPVGFSATPPRCETPACRACAAQLDETWRARREPARRAEFRVNFMRASADARDRFVEKTRPDGPFAYEHCTASTVRGASCAGLSATCVDVLARDLRSGDTPVAQRTQMNLAVDRACDAPRRALVGRLATCEPDLGPAGCATHDCRDCTAGHLAALSLLAPTADQADRAEAFAGLVRGTPELVARAIAEVLGAPDAPVDLDPVVVRRGLRAYCVDLLEHSTAPLPFSCHAQVAVLLTHPEYTREFAETWEAMRRAPYASFAAVFDRVLGAVALQPTPSAAVLQQLDRVSPAAAVEGYRRAVLLPGITPAAAAALRERLDRIGNVAPPSAAPPPPTAPSSGASGGGAAA